MLKFYLRKLADIFLINNNEVKTIVKNYDTCNILMKVKNLFYMKFHK